jgi:peptide/nickel transport system substrate-binding protein
VVVLALLVAACSRSGMQSTGAPGRANAWTIPGVVRVAEFEEPNTLVRMFSNQISSIDVTALLFEPFFSFDDHERPVPGLATEFPTVRNGLISKDGLRITFKLRPALWSDGAPVTANDVIFTWRAIVGGNNAVVRTSGYDKIKTIVADNEHQVTMVLKEPYAPAVYLFSEGDFPPLPAHLLAGYRTLDDIPYNAAPVGDGPFVLERWQHGSELDFAANPRYWRGRPRLDTIRMKIIPNTNTAVQLLQTHEIDLVDGISKPLIRDLAGLQGIRVYAQVTANYRHLDFNLRNPLLAEVAVRRAIARGIDYERVINAVYAGYGVRAATDIPPFSWAANDLAPIGYDPAAARHMLDVAGWHAGADGIRVKDGKRLSLSISSAAGNRAGESAEALIAEELKAIGVELRVKNYASALLFAEHGPLYGGTYDMGWMVDSVGPDPDDLGQWGCDYAPPHGANTEFFCDRRVDALLRDAQRQSDQSLRRDDYRRAWAILLDQAPSVVVYWDKSVVAANVDLRNFKMSPVGTDYWNCWEWEI